MSTMSDLTDRMRTCATYLRGRVRDDPDKPISLLSEIVTDAIDLLIEGATELEKPIEERIGELMPAFTSTTPVLMEQFRQEPPAKPVPVPPEAAGETFANALQRKDWPAAVWIEDDLKPIPNAPVSPNACPNCDSRASKIVQAHGRKLHLTCPVCGHSWFR